MSQNHNHLSLEMTLKIKSNCKPSTVKFTTKPHLEAHIFSIPPGMAWELNHCPRQSFPMLSKPSHDDIFPNIQTKSSLAQPEAILSHPVTCYPREEAGLHFTTIFFQAV